MSKTIWSPQSKEEEILGQPGLAALAPVRICFRCRQKFKGDEVTTACPRCKIKMIAEAHAAMSEPNGNLSPNVDRIMPGAREGKGRVVRVRLVGED